MEDEGFFDEFGGSEAQPEFYGQDIPIDSTSIQSVTYNESTQEMTVSFVGGREYSLSSVPIDVFKSFLASPSKGRFWNEQMKGVY
jgi:hypothetical protein